MLADKLIKLKQNQIERESLQYDIDKYVAYHEAIAGILHKVSICAQKGGRSINTSLRCFGQETIEKLILEMKHQHGIIITEGPGSELKVSW